MTDDFLRQRNSVICRYPHSFEKLGLGKFEYMKGNKVMKISYYLAPAEVMEYREQAAMWARCSLDAALRAYQSKKK